MADDKEKLLALRNEIDAIDRTMHELIMRRTKVVESVRTVKKDSNVKIRPSREADILYRLMAEHRGPLRPIVRGLRSCTRFVTLLGTVLRLTIVTVRVRKQSSLIL